MRCIYVLFPCHKQSIMFQWPVEKLESIVKQIAKTKLCDSLQFAQVIKEANKFTKVLPGKTVDANCLLIDTEHNLLGIPMGSLKHLSLRCTISIRLPFDGVYYGEHTVAT